MMTDLEKINNLSYHMKVNLKARWDIPGCRLLTRGELASP